jgi:hypothetical protein
MAPASLSFDLPGRRCTLRARARVRADAARHNSHSVAAPVAITMSATRIAACQVST